MNHSDDGQDDQPCWIETIGPVDAPAELAEMYQQVGAVHGQIHNLYRAFSLQPKPLVAADQHYRDILHNETNQSDPWFLELLASQAAIIANCSYALANHGANFKTLLGDAKKGDAMLAALVEDDFENNPLFTHKHSALLKYGAKLCRNPEKMVHADIADLHDAGASDTEILEVVQTTSCFAYWVRFINGLGIQLGDESIGMFDENGNKRSK